MARPARPALARSSTRPHLEPRDDELREDEDVRGRLERLASLGARSAELAHELRNALAVLETSLHLVRRALGSSPDLARVDGQLSRMSEQIHLGQALVHQALDDARGAHVERQAVDARALVVEVATGLARPDHVALEVEVASVCIDVDPRQMRQLLANLVRNAIEAVEGRERGLVRVGAVVQDGVLVLRVEDDGPGIDAAIAPRLFQAFATGKAGGTGLGLAVCRRIAEAHGGRISARARAPHGTAIVVEIPV